MLYIVKNMVNSCGFTLNESKTVSAPNYILEVESKATNTSKLIWLNTDLSLNIARYNKFNIEEVVIADQDPNQQKINLDAGAYNFYVWETESSNLVLADAIGIIESGQLRVEDDTVQPVVDPVSPVTKFVFQ